MNWKLPFKRELLSKEINALKFDVVLIQYHHTKTHCRDTNVHLC